MIVLDTNVISEIRRPNTHSSVAAWLAATDLQQTYLCGPVFMEQAYGAERHYRKFASVRYRESLQRLLAEFAGRTLPMNTEAWCRAGELRAVRDSRGRPISIGDSMIAAICIMHGATLATRNTSDFDGLDLKLVNPFEAAGSTPG